MLRRSARSLSIASIATVLVAGCPGQDAPTDPPDLGPTGGSDTSASGGTSDGSAADSTTTTSGPPGSSSGPGADEDTGSETGPDPGDSSSGGGSTGAPCPPGEDGCPCDEGTCDFGLMCIDEVCGVMGMCAADPAEANDSEATATDLGTIEDCDSDGDMVAGVLDGSDDADWFRYGGDDVAFCQVNPARTLAADGPLRLCKFAECNEAPAETEVSCPDGVTQSVSPDGRPGCCATESFEFDNLNCPGIDDDAAIYLRVDQAGAACVAYTIAYHY